MMNDLNISVELLHPLNPDMNFNNYLEKITTVIPFNDKLPY